VRKEVQTIAGAKLDSGSIVAVIIVLVLEIRWMLEDYFLAQRPT
jgi:hypothetical protein